MKEVRRACSAGDVDRAIRLLADIYAETQDPTAIYNQARCYQQNRQPEKAASRFREYLRKMPNLPADEKAQVESFVKEAEREMLLYRDPRALGASTPPAAAESAGTTSAQPSPPTVPPKHLDSAAGAPPGAVSAFPPAPPGYGYAPNPPAPSAAAAERGRPRGGLLVMPFVGFQGHQGETSQYVGIGARTGAVIGAYLGAFFSLNGQIDLDVLNLNPPAYNGVTPEEVGVDVTLAFSPFFHADAGPLELAIGPKLGFWRGAWSRTVGGEPDGSGTLGGLVWGANAGVFFPVKALGLGVLTALHRNTMSSSCFTPPGGSETCTGENLKPDTTFSMAASLIW